MERRKSLSNFESPDALLGKIADFVCVTESAISVQFEDGTTIRVAGDYSVLPAAGLTVKRITAPKVDAELFKMLQQTISTASRESDGTLTIAFENGRILKCYVSRDALRGYEIEAPKAR
jgi:hypothetical protein